MPWILASRHDCRASPDKRNVFNYATRVMRNVKRSRGTASPHCFQTRAKSACRGRYNRERCSLVNVIEIQI